MGAGTIHARTGCALISAALVKIWIDLSNSPHALLFAPIARRLEELGHTIFVTARDNAQTVELGQKYWPDLTTVGGESPGGRAAKGAMLARRVQALHLIARRERPELALSHNSYAQIVAAKLAGIRTVTAMDYEFQPANHLAFRLADRILLPEALRGSIVSRQGARPHKTRYYRGFKEEIYLGDFEPDRDVLSAIPMHNGARSVVVVRTPPELALYHRMENSLFVDVLRHLGRRADTELVALPRTRDQASALEELCVSSLRIASTALDSRSLLMEADAFLGAGGTMTREAALLGLPAYSVFAGRRAAVELALEYRGLIRFVERPDQLDLPASPPRSSERLEAIRPRGAALVVEFVAAALDV